MNQQPQNPFEGLFDQIADLLILAQDKKGEPLSGKIDENIQEQLLILEEKVDFFRKITEEAMQKSGMKEEEVQRLVENPPSQVPERELKLLEKIKKMKGEFSKIGKEFEKRGKLIQTQQKKIPSSAKKRRKKFKKLEGQGWIPL